ncbi:hypothetical protein ABZ656_57250 [Streptomyces sp. NPDC007095]|uniref:hypothetical protein n=1 Tax=Streptomyces sp. NPDC007095 TaxID=3154482 RepID=UPI0033F744F5
MTTSIDVVKRLRREHGPIPLVPHVGDLDAGYGEVPDDHHLGPEMLVLWDRGFDGNDFLAAVHATGAQVLGRISQRRRPPVLQALADSSYLSVIGGVPVRIIEARVSFTCTDGSKLRGHLPSGNHAPGRPPIPRPPPRARLSRTLGCDTKSHEIE